MPAVNEALDKPLRILLITTEYPSVERPGGAAYLVRHIKALESKGHRVDVLPFVSRANPINYYKAWIEMRRRLKLFDYDLIHAHFGQSALIARLQFSAPVVITYHGSDLIGICDARGHYTIKGKILSTLSRVMSLHADAVIVVARHLGERLPRCDWSLVPLGVDLERFMPIEKQQARRQLGWDEESFIVLFAALRADNPVKRLSLCKAACKLLQNGFRAELKIVQGVSPDEMPLFMCAADALLVTSLHEGSPTVVKEALACNLPVVTTDVGDVCERLEGVHPSFICEPDPAMLASALRELAIAGAPRSNGRSRIQLLAEPLVADRVVEVYRSVLSRRCIAGAQISSPA